MATNSSCSCCSSSSSFLIAITLLQYYHTLAVAALFIGILVVVTTPEGAFVSGQITTTTTTTTIPAGSRLLGSELDRAWVSENGTFAFGFTPTDPSSNNELDSRLIVGIWFAKLPRDQRALVWSANRDSPVDKSAVLEFDGNNLVLLDGRHSTIWTSNISSTGSGGRACVLAETGNLIVYDSNNNQPLWQSFSHPTDTLLPSQPLKVLTQLISAASSSSSRGYYYALKMLQQPTSLTLALSYHTPAAAGGNYNYSYWEGPDISNSTGEVVAVVDDEGSFGIVYGDGSSGAVYVYKNSGDDTGLASAVNSRTSVAPAASVHRRLTLESTGNLQLYRWDDNLNGSSQWVPVWAAVSNPCDIAGTCGNGICSLDKTTKTTASCTCLHQPRPNQLLHCSDASPLLPPLRAGNNNNKCGKNNQFKISSFQQTNYHFSSQSVIANYSSNDTTTTSTESVSWCGSRCLSDCECVASVYGLRDSRPYCWVLRSLDFGGFQDPSSTLFVKVLANQTTILSSSSSSDGRSNSAASSSSSSSSMNARTKATVLPVLVTMGALIALLCLLLYYYTVPYRRHQYRLDKSAVNSSSSLIFSGAPLSYTYLELQSRTANFSELLGVGGFGSVYKGTLPDGTLIAVKKLDRVLPQGGEREFVTEVNTIGSLHHMNLVRLCGYCSEGVNHRLLVYEFMKNGSLDKWIFPSNSSDKNKPRGGGGGGGPFLDWRMRYAVALGTARGISYFHEQCRDGRVIHCDIKPENILLDDNFNPKVSDFGLAQLVGRDPGHDHYSRIATMVRGTRGYLAPEWLTNRPVTVKADVYSYGMLLLEIVGGRRNLDMSLGQDDFFFPGKVFREMTAGTPLKAVDARLISTDEAAGRGVVVLQPVNEDEVTRALRVGFWCIQDDASARPSMGEVVKMLEGTGGIMSAEEEIQIPPMPQSVVELIQEGLDQVYRAMRRDFVVNFRDLTASTTDDAATSSFTLNTSGRHHRRYYPSSSSSRATCSNSTMSPR